MRIRITFVALCVLAWASLCRASPRGILYTLLRDNVAGGPVVHQKQDWPFDPDVGLRRRDEFQRAHGYRGYNLVEEAGLGDDGRQQERRQQQAYRDSFPVPPEVDWQPNAPQPGSPLPGTPPQLLQPRNLQPRRS